MPLPEGVNFEDGPSDRAPRPTAGRSDRPERGRKAGDRVREARPPRSQAPVDVPVAAEVEAVAAPLPAPEPRRTEREERPVAPREPRERRPDDRRDRRDDRRDGGVVGMGDHVPDFILRSFQIAADTADEAEEKSTGTEG